jgi:hypothetical protein
MSDEPEPTLQPDLDVGPHDHTGAGIVALFKQSADLAECNSRYALEIAQKLSRRLAPKQILYFHW